MKGIKNITLLCLMASFFMTAEAVEIAQNEDSQMTEETQDAQQGKYERKSLTSVGVVHVQDRLLLFRKALIFTGNVVMNFASKNKKYKNYFSRVWSSNAKQFDYNAYDILLDFYIGDMPRFDHNSLPKAWLDEVQTSFKKSRILLGVPFLRKMVLKNILNKYITPRINIVLSNPDVARQMQVGFDDSASLETFAATKAQDFQMTEDELMAIMNTAYIYIPYVSSSLYKWSRGKYKTKMRGGIYYWQFIQNAETGEVELDAVHTAKHRGTGEVKEVVVKEEKRGKKGKTIVVSRPVPVNYSSLNGNNWDAFANQRSINDAQWSMMKNLQTKTKMYDPFKLRGQVLAVNDKEYTIPLGNMEGVNLDDTFDLVQPYETKKGKVKNKRVGYMRVTQRGDNKDSASNYSTATQLFGKPQTPGTVALEYPLLGVSYYYTGGMRLMHGIDPNSTFIPPTELFTTDEGKALLGGSEDPAAIAESWNADNPDNPIRQVLSDKKITMYFGNWNFAYNLAPVTGRSQLFATGIYEYGLLLGTDAAGFSASNYFGLKQKKGGRLNYSYEALLGYDVTSLSNTVNEAGMTKYMVGARVGGDLGFMLTRRISLSAAARYNMIIPAWFSFQNSYSGEPDDYDLYDTGPNIRETVSCDWDENPDCIEYTGWNTNSDAAMGSYTGTFNNNKWYFGGLNLSLSLSWELRYSQLAIWSKFDDRKKF